VRAAVSAQDRERLTGIYRRELLVGDAGSEAWAAGRAEADMGRLFQGLSRAGWRVSLSRDLVLDVDRDEEEEEHVAPGRADSVWAALQDIAGPLVARGPRDG
jgi:hypothetical protein